MKCKKKYADMDKFRAYRNRHKKKYYDKTATYEPVAWTQAQEEMVLKHEIPDSQLSGLIGHSVNAIQKRRWLLKKLLVLPLLLLVSMPVQAEEIKEPQLMRCTVYTAPEGAITADGSKVREGIVAGKREWLGYTCIIYDKNLRLIGLYEVKDTGGTEELKNGTVIDVFRNDLDACKDWVNTYGDYCYIQILKGKG